MNAAGKDERQGNKLRNQFIFSFEIAGFESEKIGGD
jgi:hypothetical protein